MRKVILLSILMFSTAIFAEELIVPLPDMPALNNDLIVPPSLIDIPKVEEKKAEEPKIDVTPPVILVEKKDCPADFHKAISALEPDRAKLWDLMNAAKKPDISLSARQFSTPVVKGEKMLMSLRGRNGVDATLFTTHPTGDILYRSLAEFKGYTTQKPYAGICAGATFLTKFYMERNVALFKRADDYKASAALFKDEADKELGETPRRTSLIAAHYFIRDAGGRYMNLADGVKKLFSDVDAAHLNHCKC
jgi:hypothetical protein